MATRFYIPADDDPTKKTIELNGTVYTVIAGEYVDDEPETAPE